MIEVVDSSIETPIFRERNVDFYAALTNTGFALLEFEENPSDELVEAVRELRHSGEPRQLVVGHVFGRMNDVDQSRDAAGLAPIKSTGVEVFVKEGFEGSNNPHVDRTHRDTERVVEVIDEPRRWHIWLPRPELIERRSVDVKGVSPDAIIRATPGSALVFNMRRAGQSHSEAKRSTIIHSYFPDNDKSLSLLYARVHELDLIGRLSAIRYKAPKFPRYTA